MVLLSTALGLFNFAWNQSAVVGWPVGYVWGTLLAAGAAFVAFYFWERKAGRAALVPTEVRIELAPALIEQVLQKTSLLVYLSLWLGWMSFGVFLYYTTLL